MEKLQEGAKDGKKDHPVVDQKIAMTSWENLREEYKESNRAHADSIPRKLRLIDCYYLAPEDQYWEDKDSKVGEFSQDEIDTLAKVEHERFKSERLQKQWYLGERTEHENTSPFLRPWEDVGEDWKNLQRALVRAYKTILSEYPSSPNGHKLYWTKKKKLSNTQTSQMKREVQAFTKLRA